MKTGRGVLAVTVATALVLVSQMMAIRPVYGASADPVKFEDLSVVQDFKAGRITFRSEAVHQELDAKTLSDLEAQKLLIDWILGYAPSELVKKRIQWLLTHPYLDRQEIRHRQQAVRFIANNEDLFQFLAARFERAGSFEHIDQEEILNILGRPGWMLSNFGMSVAAGAAGLAIPAYALVTGQVQMWSLLAPLYANVLFSRGTTLSTLDMSPTRRRADTLGQAQLENSMSGFEFGQELIKACETEQACIDSVRRLGKVVPPSRGVRELLSMTGISPVLFLPARIQSMRNREAVIRMLSVSLELEVQYTFAKLYRAHRDHMIFPTILDQATPRLSIENGHHPYLRFDPTQESVGNSVQFSGGEGRDAKNIYILTGPNTGGKTTFLRMIMHLMILAQAGLPVPASAMELTPSYLFSSFANVGDSTVDGASTFFAQAKRVADMERKIREVAPHALFLAMDEILTGTSKPEHQAAERGVLQSLGQSPNILSILATHDRTLTTLADENSHIGNLQVTLRGHRISDGASQTYNAFQVMQAAGVSAETLAATQQIFAANHPEAVCEPLLNEAAEQAAR